MFDRVCFKEVLSFSASFPCPWLELCLDPFVPFGSVFWRAWTFSFGIIIVSHVHLVDEIKILVSAMSGLASFKWVKFPKLPRECLFCSFSSIWFVTFFFVAVRTCSCARFRCDESLLCSSQEQLLLSQFKRADASSPRGCAWQCCLGEHGLLENVWCIPSHCSTSYVVVP